MTKKDKLNQLTSVLTDAFAASTETDNTSFDFKRIAAYLLDYGVDVHYMADFENCWRIDVRFVCTASDEELTPQCLGDDLCAACMLARRSFKLHRSLYDHRLDDADFGITVFRTREEAEAALKKLEEIENANDKRRSD